jgi:hypothetical protein
MRRPLRRALLILALAVFVGSITGPGRLAAQFMPDATTKVAPRKELPHVERKMTARERALDTAKKKREAKILHDTRVWQLGRDSGRPTLAFAKPGGEDPSISFSCDVGAGLVRIIAFNVSAKGMKTGDAARLRLSNGPARLEVAATALPNDKNANAVDIGGTTKVTPRLFSLFRGDAIVLEVPGRTTGLSLKSISPKGEAFEKACIRQR